jgi:hypothetical protein
MLERLEDALVPLRGDTEVICCHYQLDFHFFLLLPGLAAEVSPGVVAVHSTCFRHHWDETFTTLMTL